MSLAINLETSNSREVVNNKPISKDLIFFTVVPVLILIIMIMILMMIPSPVVTPMKIARTIIPLALLGQAVVNVTKTQVICW